MKEDGRIGAERAVSSESLIHVIAVLWEVAKSIH
jgi:hypothetical protein